MFSKKNIPLYFALGIPVIMIIAIAIAIYVPGIGKAPVHNFLYMSGNLQYPSNYQYIVQSGQLQQVPVPTPIQSQGIIMPTSTTNFYIYNVKTNTASPISFSEAQKLQLDSSNTLSDGYTIQQGNGSGGDFFFGSGGSDYNSWYIKGHNRATKLNLKLTSSPSYYNNFQFLGWVE